MKTTLFEQAGGFAKVRLVVSELYDRMLASERLAPHFDGIDMRRLVDHQTKMVASMMGGPASFTDEQIGRAHGHLNITVGDFAEMLELLVETLEDFGMSDEEVGRVAAHVQSLKDRIVAPATAQAGAP